MLLWIFILSLSNSLFQNLFQPSHKTHIQAPLLLFSFLYLLSSSSVHREQSRASALSISAEVKKTSLLSHERDLVTSKPPLITQKHIFSPFSLAAIFSSKYSLTAFFIISLYIKMPFPALITGQGIWQAHLGFQSQRVIFLCFISFIQDL